MNRLALVLVPCLITVARAQDAPAPRPVPADEGAMPEPTEAVATTPGDTTPGQPGQDDSGIEAASEPGRGLGHAHQFGVSSTLASGYRAVFPYGDKPCAQDTTKSVCTGRSPVTLDLGVSYALADGYALLFELRLGLEEEKQIEKRATAFMPGLKIYFEPRSALKFFLTAQAYIETADYEGTGVKSTDVGARGELGIQVDLMRHFGLYLQGGATVGFRRWLSFLGEGGGGLQVRFP